jgi:phosphoserine phosphatase
MYLMNVLLQALEQRLQILDCTPDDIRRFLQTYPPEPRVMPGAKDLILALRSRGVEVYLISGGFRCGCVNHRWA